MGWRLTTSLHVTQAINEEKQIRVVMDYWHRRITFQRPRRHGGQRVVSMDRYDEFGGDMNAFIDDVYHPLQKRAPTVRRRKPTHG